jgi:UDP-glucose 4-epimerase
MNILVTGGAGYIGSHAVKRLLDEKHKVAVIDNLSRGHIEAIDCRADFYRAKLSETDKLLRILLQHRIECVMHFAGLTYVGESVRRPLDYYRNNVSGAISLLDAMDAAHVKQLVFSSTAAVFGEPKEVPIHCFVARDPINPYGRSKYFIEEILHNYSTSDRRFTFAVLRYFNVAGAAFDGSIGEDHKPETHLIPSLLLSALLSKQPRAQIFGIDYPTPDGTCIRDYVHVEDLITAHILAMESLKSGETQQYNIGIGRGYSVREVIDAVQRITGVAFEIEELPRRPGDPSVLYANSDRIKRDLNWSPKYGLDAMITTAWNWFQNHPNGYIPDTHASG